MSNDTKSLVEDRARAWEQAKEILDRQRADGGRDRTAEENESYARANADIDRLDNIINDIQRSEQLQREGDIARAAFEGYVPTGSGDHTSERDEVMAFIRGEHGQKAQLEVNISAAAQQAWAIREGMTGADLRNAALQSDGGASGGSLVVPTRIESTIYAFMEQSSAIRRISRVITTSNGEGVSFPQVVTHAVGTQIATQDTAIGGTDPVVGVMTLNAFDFGELIAVAQNLVDDASFDVVGFVGEQIGRAIGRVTDTKYVTGGGTTDPKGIITAMTGSVITGGTLIEATFEKLIDLQFSLATDYFDGASWVMKPSTGASLRKIRAGAGGTEGDFIWSPSVVPGQPDTLLGAPVYFDGNVAAQGSAAKSVIYGDFNAFYVRDVAGLSLDRSEEFLFNKNQVAFRGVLRTDSDLIDVNAIKCLHQRA